MSDHLKLADPVNYTMHYCVHVAILHNYIMQQHTCNNTGQSALQSSAAYILNRDYVTLILYYFRAVFTLLHVTLLYTEQSSIT